MTIENNVFGSRTSATVIVKFTDTREDKFFYMPANDMNKFIEKVRAEIDVKSVVTEVNGVQNLLMGDFARNSTFDTVEYVSYEDVDLESLGL